MASLSRSAYGYCKPSTITSPAESQFRLPAGVMIRGVLVASRAQVAARAEVVAPGARIVAGEVAIGSERPAQRTRAVRQRAGNVDEGAAGERGRAEARDGPVGDAQHVEVAILVVCHRTRVEHCHRAAGKQRPGGDRTPCGARVVQGIVPREAAGEFEIVAERGQVDARLARDVAPIGESIASTGNRMRA